MQHATATFTGLNNVTIFTQHWLPDEAPHAAVIIAHGIGEHSGRYAHVAAYLVAHGYAVYALDHRGHGQSGGGRLEVRDFDEFVADLRAYFEQVRAAHPDLPIFLYGHSMGSLIALRFALRYQDDLAGLITTGTAFRPVRVNAVTIRLVKSAAGLIPNARLIPLNSKGISRDPDVVRRYDTDPLVYHGRIPFGILGGMVRAVEQIINGLPALRIPYLALHGRDDPMTHVRATEIIQQTCGSPDLTVKIYDDLYHEIHNEPEQEQVFRDIVDWLDAHL